MHHSCSHSLTHTRLDSARLGSSAEFVQGRQRGGAEFCQAAAVLRRGGEAQRGRVQGGRLVEDGQAEHEQGYGYGYGYGYGNG